MSIQPLITDCDTVVNSAVEALYRGGFILVTDDKDRENEADLVIAASSITPETVAFMVRHTGGVLTVPMMSDRLEALYLKQMVEHNTEVNRTAFTVSVDYRHGTTSGISAQDRAKTIRALVDPLSRPEDFARPGHVFPLRYRDGGVLKRAGHTEAAIDLCHLAAVYPAAVISELVNDDGSMSRGEEVVKFSKLHNIPLVSIAELIRYRRHREKLVTRMSSARIPTDCGEFTAYVYSAVLDGIEHMALVKGTIDRETPVLVRVHSECLTGDAFGSLRCDCGWQLRQAMQRIAEEGSGIIVYLRGHEGRGIGLGHKMRAYNLQDQGHDTVQANISLGLPVDSREYGIGAQILVDLGVSKMRLMTNNPAKYGGLDGYDLQIVDRVPVVPEVNKDNLSYLQAKQDKLGHLLSLAEPT